MALSVELTAQFKKDLKKAKKQEKNLSYLQKIMQKIELEDPLLQKLKDHPLIGNWNHHRELHLESDWLLIYRIIPDEKVVIFVRLGSHSNLFS